MINFDEDADIFLDTDEFSVVAVYGGENVNVLFDLTSDDQVEELLPILRGKKSDFEGITYGDRITVNGKLYGVMNWYDENSMLVIVMNEVD